MVVRRLGRCGSPALVAHSSPLLSAAHLTPGAHMHSYSHARAALSSLAPNIIRMHTAPRSAARAGFMSMSMNKNTYTPFWYLHSVLGPAHVLTTSIQCTSGAKVHLLLTIDVVSIIFACPLPFSSICPFSSFFCYCPIICPCKSCCHDGFGAPEVLKPHAAAVTKGGNYSSVTNSGHAAAGMSMKYGCGDVTPTLQHSLLCTPPSPSSQAHGKYHNCSIIFVILDPRLLMASSRAIDRDETGIGLEPI